jgi:hypothetical protein
LTDHDLLRGFFIAGGVGVIAFSRTEPTGERIGCTGECGVCGAMAAAGIVEMVGGMAQQVEDAASLALQAGIGMPCDPIPRGLGQPCRSRVLTAACMAHVFADLALAGHSLCCPFMKPLMSPTPSVAAFPPNFCAPPRAAPALLRQPIAAPRSIDGGMRQAGPKTGRPAS